MIFVCVDDDAIPRILAQSTLERAKADPHRSRILGAAYEEVAGVVEFVAGLAEEVGAERIVLCLDQNMDYDEGTFKGSELCSQLRSERLSPDLAALPTLARSP